MTLRSTRARLMQALWFESVGLCISVPVFLFFVGGDAKDGFFLLVVISVLVMVWSPLYNTAFDWLDPRFTGRTACRRPRALRLVHAVRHTA